MSRFFQSARKSAAPRVGGERFIHSHSWFDAAAQRANKCAKYLSLQWFDRFGSVATVSTVAFAFIGTVTTARWFRKDNDKFMADLLAYRQTQVRDEVNDVKRQGKRVSDLVSPQLVPSTLVPIFVKQTNRNIFVLSVDVGDTVEALKEQICGIAGIEVEDQIIFHEGAKLEDARTVVEYNIQKDSIIHLFDTSSGGGSSSCY